MPRRITLSKFNACTWRPAMKTRLAALALAALFLTSGAFARGDWKAAQPAFVDTGSSTFAETFG